MSIVGIILIVFLIIQFFSKKSSLEKIVINFAILAAFTIFINIGSFINVGRFDLAYEEFLSAIVGIQILIYISKSKINKKLFYSSLSFFLIVLFSICLIVLVPFNSLVLPPGTATNYNYFLGADDILRYPSISAYTIRYFVRIVIMILFCIFLYQIVEKDIKKINNIVLKFGEISLIYCVFEFISKNLLGTTLYSTFLKILFGQNPSGTVLPERGGISPITGFKFEPAQLSEGLWLFSLILIFSSKSKRYKLIILLFNFSIMLMSRSLKGIGFIVAITLIYLLFNFTMSKKHILFGLIGIILATTISLSLDYTYYMERVNNIISILKGEGFMVYNSENIRLKTVIDAFELFVQCPIFGIGLGTTFAYGAIPMILTNIGLIGFAIWIKLIGVTSRIKLNMSIFLLIFIMACIYITNGSISLLYNPIIPLILINVSRYKGNIEQIILTRG